MEKPADIYAAVAEKAIKALQEIVGRKRNSSESDQDDEEAEKEAFRVRAAQWWLDFGITRKVCKRNCMTFPYGSKERGFSDQILEDTLRPHIKEHGALLAEKETVEIELMKGTWEDAVLYAMTSNQQHGKDISGHDKARAVGIILNTFKPDFGFDSKKVTPWLMAKGFKKTTAMDFSKELRMQIDDKRDDEILRLHYEGMSQRKIAEAVGCSKGSVQNVLEETDGQNDRSGENVHLESDAASYNVTEDDLTPAVNPADAETPKALPETEAFKKALSAPRTQTV